MQDFDPGANKVEGRPDTVEGAVLDVVLHPNSVGEMPVSRRGALRAGATALLGATVVVATATDTGTALASSAEKKSDKSTTSKPKPLTINVNGKDHVVTGGPDSPLLYVLRNELELHGPRFGCGLSQCGACAVLVDGKQIRSCVTPVAGVAFADGKNKITTVEGLPGAWAEQRKAAKRTSSRKTKKGHVEDHFKVGLNEPAKLHPIQQAWIDQQVPQCGYCQSGMMIQAAALLAKTPHPTEAQIKTAMNGHLCRCGTYTAIIEGIQEASKTMAKELA